MKVSGELKSRAFLKLASGRWAWGEGPFSAHPRPLDGQACFYVNDFGLKDPYPWKRPARFEILNDQDFLAARTPPGGGPSIDWRPLGIENFERHFQALQKEIDGGRLRKGVPYVFEEGLCADPRQLQAWMIQRLGRLPDTLTGYGWFEANAGFMGATPELLFQVHDSTLETMALASSRPKGRGEELLSDPKELSEHRMVVEDLQTQLRGLGPVKVGATSLLELPAIVHLHTPLSVELQAPPDYSSLLRIFHPTAALGAFPRGEAADTWLRSLEGAEGRGSFGAPFGFVSENGEARFVVAIRQIQVEADRLRVGSGCGVLAESRLEKEWNELAIKRDSVKSLFL